MFLNKEKKRDFGENLKKCFENFKKEFEKFQENCRESLRKLRKV